MAAPETRYAHSGDVSIAYRVIGAGPLDLVMVPGAITHLEHAMTEPALARYVERFASFARVIVFDKRGTGMSDREAGLASLEERMDDVRAVMDAAGSERAAVLGVSEGGPMAILFAATYPSRTAGLILYGTFPRVAWAPDWPGLTDEELDAREQLGHERFGEGPPLELWAPSVAGDPEKQRWWGTHERLGASPGAARRLLRMNREIDVRAVLPTIGVPTLVLHRRDDRIVPLLAGAYIASQIPGATFVELAGEDHFPFYGDSDSVIGEIEEFLTGTRHYAEPNRVLATVTFTDIVDSTATAARVGDAEWRAIMDRHDEMAGRTVARFSGRLVKHTGDGVLATFDGPARATRFAAALGEELAPTGMRIRAGVHTGEVEMRNGDLGGIAVHIAARVAHLAGPGEILVSRTVKDLTVGAGLTFADRGTHALKGVPEEWQIFAVTAV